MALYVIRYGCGCGEEVELIKAETFDKAMDCAYEAAVENYESFEGLHGVMDREDIAEEFGLEDEDEIDEAYIEERENTISYFAEELDLENDEHAYLYEEWNK